MANTFDEDSSNTQSLLSSIVGDTDIIWKHLVSPPKHSYLLESLGPIMQLWGDFTYKRSDHDLTNKNGHQMFYTYL